MPHYSETIEIGRPPDVVWQALTQPERWVEGYVETKSRSPGYPDAETRNDHVYRTRMKEDVSAQVLRSQAGSLLEEQQTGKTFSRRVVYRLEPGYAGTKLSVEDDVDFKGLGKLAGPIATRDVKKRWERSLENLRNVVQAGG